MGVYLKIGDADVSGFITENEYSVMTAPVYDEESEFVNIYGRRVRTRTGREITLSAKLYDVDNAAAAEVCSALSGGSALVTFCAPEELTSEFDALKLSVSLDRVYNGERYWTIELLLHAFVSEGL